MPTSMPGDRGRVEQPPVLVAHRGRDLHDHPHDRADADAEQQRRQARVEGGGADPGAEDRRRAGDQAERRAGARARPLAARRRRRAAAPRSPAPRWCCGSRSRRRGRRPAPAPRSRRRSRSPAPRRGCAGRSRSRPAAPGRRRRRQPRRAARLRRRQPGVDARPAPGRRRGRRGRRGWCRRRRPAPRRRSPAPRAPASIARKASRPTVKAISGADPAPPEAAEEGQPEHPEADRDHADVDPQQRHQAVEARVGLRRLAPRPGSSASIVAAGGGEDEDLVGLAFDPGVGDLQRGRAEPADLVAAVGGEGRVGVVDGDLGDPDRVGPVVAQGQLDLARVQRRALDRDFLQRRPGALAEPGAAEQGEGADRDRDQGQRDRAQRPGRQAAGGRARLAPRPPSGRCPSRPRAARSRRPRRRRRSGARDRRRGRTRSSRARRTR